MAYEIVIGLEAHAQLLTASKMFCGCSTAFGAAPNTQTCPVCLGMPGVLPVINQKAVEFAIRTGLALNCTIAPMNRFARKNYFYPDLPKGYQISQYELPICQAGWVEIGENGTAKRIRIRRAHLEEDAGKNLHTGIAGASHVDLNRAGTPLLEIVTEPDMRSPDEAVAYLKKLRDILVYLEVCDGNMEEGSLRCEPNLSLRPAGSKEFGTKVELKNINSFKFVKAAMEYEIKRQTKVLSEGGKIVQETRLWDTEKGETAVMRSKEEAHDYRYFPDPDLVPLRILGGDEGTWPPSGTFPQQQRQPIQRIIDDEGYFMVEEIRKTLPELPEAMRKRFMEEYGLPEYDADVLTSAKALAKFFEDTVKAQAEATALSGKELGKETSNWVMVELLGLLHKGKPKADGGTEPWTIEQDPYEQSPVTPRGLAELLVMKRKGEVSGPIAKTVLEEMFATGKSAAEIIKAKGLTQVSDEGALEKIIDEVMAQNPQQLAQYRSGKEQLFGFFVGQVMKASGGKANPAKVNELLKRKLAG
jgi:aspartyl-tRNA(Asn)/glutamyl-tRNA(Gln) amidotransferase subunit B